MQLADGVPECLKAVRMQLRAGANVIKICGSGGVGSERDNPVDQQFSEEEMKAMVDEAARAQRIIGAHCHGKPGIMAALRSGVKTIEHGSYIDEECADLMLEKGATLVATRLIIANGLTLGEKYMAPYAWEKLKALADSHWKAMQTAIHKGVKIAIGTDTTGTTPGSELLRFDRVGKELYYHVKAGMSPLEAIEAATANGPSTLGPQAPKAGILREGYDADFIGLDKNPLEDIGVLTGPDHVTHVWKGGKCYKSPGHPVSIL
jgi:imidazolonepropionase-like amidohydrolase